MSITKRLLIFILGISLLCFAGCGSKDKNDNPNSTSQKTGSYSGEKMSDEIFDFTIKIDDITYVLPSKLENFINSCWEYDNGNNPEENDVAGESYDTCIMKNSNGDITITVVNPTGNVAKFKDCYVGSIDFALTNSNNCKYELSKGLKISTKTKSEDVTEKWGEPTTRLPGQYGETLRYEKDTYVYYQFYFDENGHLNGFDMRNWVAPENKSSNGERPAYLDNYKAPQMLSDDYLSYTFRLQNNYYTFPTPVSEFVENGWQIVTKVEHVAAGQEVLSGVRMKKDNVELTFNIKNYSEWQVDVENAMVTSVYINSTYYSNLDFELSGGVTFGMGIDDFKERIDLEGYEKTLYSNTTEYQMTKYSNHFCFIFNSQDKLSEINFGKNTIE